MGPYLFIIGGTGHIGGAVLDQIVKRQPDLSIRVLVRSQTDVDNLQSQYPVVESIVGTLDDKDLVRNEVSAANIIIYCAPDVAYPLVIRDILATLEEKSAPSFYIGTSGAARLFGSQEGAQGRVWDDVADFNALPPDPALHAMQDDMVLAANSKTVKTAIVSPPFVVGVSPSRSHPTPLVFPSIFEAIEELGSGFSINDGLNRTCFTDVKDLAQVYVKLVEDALGRLSGNSTTEEHLIWGSDAYYFPPKVVNITFAEWMRHVLVPLLQKHEATFVKSEEIKALSVDEFASIGQGEKGGEGSQFWRVHLGETFGADMQTYGSRASRLGLQPSNYEDNSTPFDEAVRIYLST